MPDTQPPETPADPEPRATSGALLTVFLVVMIDLLGFGIVLPILPRLASDYLKPVLGTEKSPLVGATTGLLMASFSIMQFLFAPIWGRVSDRYGRRPILLMGLLGSVVFYSVLGVAALFSTETAESAGVALALMFVYRIGTGVFGATISAAQAVIADVTTPETRSRGMALVGAAFGVGFTFGPLLGAGSALVIGHDSAIGFVAAGLSLVALLLGLRLLPETLAPGHTASHRHWFDWASLRAALASPSVGVIILTFFLSSFAFANFENTLSLLTKSLLGLGKESNYLIFAYVGLMFAIAQGGIYRRLARRVSEVTFMQVGTVLMAGSMFALALLNVWVPHPEALEHGPGWEVKGTFLVILAVTVTGFAFVTPSAQSLVSRRTDPTKQGGILGVNQSASALARILGPLVGLSLLDIPGTSQTLPYLVSGAVLGGVFFLIARLRADPDAVGTRDAVSAH